METNPAYGSYSLNAANNVYEMVDASKCQESVRNTTEFPIEATSHRLERRKAQLSIVIWILIVIVVFAAFVLALAAIILTFTVPNQKIETLKKEVVELQEQLFPTDHTATSSPLANTIPGEIVWPTTSLTTTSEVTETTVPTQVSGSLLGSPENPAASCKDISQDMPSGEYWIQTNSTNSTIQVYCDTSHRNESCSSNTGGWMRVVNLNMNDPTQQCPDGLTLTTRSQPPLRTCGRSMPYSATCSSAFFQTHGVRYSYVHGRVIGYQYGQTTAFATYYHQRGTTIDSGYLDGFSLTYGQSPRQHIWTFVGATDETRSDMWVCPCTRPDLNFTGSVPPFIGNDYFCDTGSREQAVYTLYANDPLWDGQGCGSASTCCEFNNPPWFCKQLPVPTSSNIELRICHDSSFYDEDTPLEIVEVYVQ